MQAQIWIDALRDAGLEAGTFERGPGPALGGAVTPGFAAYVVIVRRTEVARARSVIAEISGGEVLAPLPDEQEESRRRAAALLTVGLVVGVILLLLVLGRFVGG
ncbi:MAG: hypothetical protein WEC33_09080 [Dehalococcoidia bacterium]